MKKFLLSALIAAGSVGVHAEGLYIGVAAGGSHLNLHCASGVSCDEGDTGFKLLGGYKLTKNVAVEAHYVDYGNVKGRVSGDTSGFDIAADANLSALGVGLALLGDFTPAWNGVVRAGLARNKLKTSGSAGGFSFFDSDTSTNAYIGAGVGYKLTQEITVNAAVDYTRKALGNEAIKATLYTIGATYNF